MMQKLFLVLALSGKHSGGGPAHYLRGPAICVLLLLAQGVAALSSSEDSQLPDPRFVESSAHHLNTYLGVAGVGCAEKDIAVSHDRKMGHIEWTTNYQEAEALAKKENRPLLLFFTGTDWCGWCKRLVREVFDDPEFAEKLGNRFVFVELDFPMRKTLPEAIVKQNQELKEKYKIDGYPTVVIVSPSGQKLGVTGYREGGARAYAEHLQSFLTRS